MSCLTAETIQGLSGRERLALAIDTDDTRRAIELSDLARGVGAVSAKYGLELLMSRRAEEISEIAGNAGLEWIADFKLQFDEGDNVEKIVSNLTSLDHPPFGITIHTQNTLTVLQRAAEAAGDTILFGVTALTHIKDGTGPGQSQEVFKKSRSAIVPELAMKAIGAGLTGLVCSPLEVGSVKANPTTGPLIILSPGSRSRGAKTHDQANTATPEFTMAEGADLLVTGRQVTEADDPVAEFESIGEEADRGILLRKNKIQ